VLVHTDAGFLFLYNLQTSMWRVLYHDQSYGSYAVLSVDDSNRMVAVGNTSGSMSFESNERDVRVFFRVFFSIRYFTVIRHCVQEPRVETDLK